MPRFSPETLDKAKEILNAVQDKIQNTDTCYKRIQECDTNNPEECSVLFTAIAAAMREPKREDSSEYKLLHSLRILLAVELRDQSPETVESLKGKSKQVTTRALVDASLQIPRFGLEGRKKMQEYEEQKVLSEGLGIFSNPNYLEQEEERLGIKKPKETQTPHIAGHRH